MDKFTISQKNLGPFTYYETGFILKKHSKLVTYRWDDILTVFAFKEDRITTDEICVEIFMNDNSCLKIEESIPGWFQFNKRLAEVLPITQNWENDVILPPFKANLTLLFDRKGRNKEQAVIECYK